MRGLWIEQEYKEGEEEEKYWETALVKIPG